MQNEPKPLLSTVHEAMIFSAIVGMFVGIAIGLVL